MKYRIEQDTDPMNPRTDWDNFGTMVCFHRRYLLGDKDHGYDSADYDGWHAMSEDIQKREDVAVMLPLYLYDHGGITMSTGSFNDHWDSGQVGFIFVTKEKAREWFKQKRLTKKLLKRVTEALEAEVETYDQYLRGDVYGYVVEDNGEEVESCWGFFGYDHCEEEAKAALLHCEHEKGKTKTKVPAPVCATA